MNPTNYHALSEKSTGILVFIESYHQEPLMKQVFLLKNIKWNDWSFFPALIIHDYPPFLYEINKHSSWFYDFLGCEYLSVL